MHRQKVILKLESLLSEEIDASAEVTLDVIGLCPDSRGLTGRRCQLQRHDDVLIGESEFEQRPALPPISRLRFVVPNLVGGFRGRVILTGSGDFDTSPLEIAFKVKAHNTSLAVWDVISPQTLGQSFKVMAGATCSCGCTLAGDVVEVHDGTGVVARGTLNEKPWANTRALYWTELQLTAPSRPGAATWDVRFAADGLTPPHRPAQYQFNVQIVPPPECRVTIRTTDKASGEPLRDARVRLGVYFADTDAAGFVRFDVPKDSFELDVMKPGYDVMPAWVKVSDDIDLQVAMSPVRKASADSYWYNGTAD